MPAGTLVCGCHEGEGCPTCAPWGPSEVESLMATARVHLRLYEQERKLRADDGPPCRVCGGHGVLHGYCCSASPSRVECACGGALQEFACEDCAGTGVAS